MTALAGGMEPVPAKITGKLTSLRNLFFHLRLISHWMRGHAAPIRKKKTRPLS